MILISFLHGGDQVPGKQTHFFLRMEKFCSPFHSAHKYQYSA